MVQCALLSILLALAGIVQAATTTCNFTSPCSSSSASCCSEFGYCGTKRFCLGGCNPFTSNNLKSCRPQPVCRNSQFTFSDQSRILSNSTSFNGDASKYDWTVEKGTIQNDNGDLVLILTETNGGTRLSTTRYVYYGTITAKLKTGRWGGVVTAFVTMSNIKDEIDWEWTGAKTTSAQSNYFWQGTIPNKTQGQTHTNLLDTYSNYHDYTIDWQPDKLTWSIDGRVVRTLKKSDAIAGHYPSTPSRIQLSIWPAGTAEAPQGTLDWAGGMINWDDPDYKSAGHFYASVNKVTIKCLDKTSYTSYIYEGTKDQTTISLSNRSTLINGINRLVPALGADGLSFALFLGLLLCFNALLL